jgi:hypothetical protein
VHRRQPAVAALLAYPPRASRRRAPSPSGPAQLGRRQQREDFYFGPVLAKDCTSSYGSSAAVLWSHQTVPDSPCRVHDAGGFLSSSDLPNPSSIVCIRSPCLFVYDQVMQFAVRLGSAFIDEGEKHGLRNPE